VGSVLEHFRRPNLFLRKNKNVYVSILTEELIEKLQLWRARTSYPKVRKRLMKVGLPMRTYDARKAFATYLGTHGVEQATIDLIQGRVGGSIFSSSYFRPNVEDMVSRVKAVLTPYVKKLLEKS
jgi:intergrase/recombinase